MRIIAGSLGGRLFDSPHSARTHPMSDKARGALFNVLGDIERLSVLDAFAGTGALSFEAVSRGAASSLAIECDRSAQRIIHENIRALSVGKKVQLVSAMAGAWLRTNPEATFDIVLCDPPHDDLQFNLLNRLAERAKPGGLVVLSLPPQADFELPATNYQLAVSKSYGDIKLLFYRRHAFRT